MQGCQGGSSRRVELGGGESMELSACALAPCKVPSRPRQPVRFGLDDMRHVIFWASEIVDSGGHPCCLAPGGLSCDRRVSGLCWRL